MDKKILVIEDDNVLQKAVSIALKEAGFRVHQAFNGEEGVEKAKLFKPDLILLDLLMPVMDGREALKIIKKDNELKDIPVIIFTVYEQEQAIAECNSMGAKGYFLKSSYSLEDIVNKVNEILE